MGPCWKRQLTGGLAQRTLFSCLALHFSVHSGFHGLKRFPTPCLSAIPILLDPANFHNRSQKNISSLNFEYQVCCPVRENQIIQKIDAKSVVIAVTVSGQESQKPLKMFCRRNLERLQVQASEALECCKQSLLGNFGWQSEDQNADRNVDSEGS